MTDLPDLRIDPLAESLALTTSGNVKNLIIGALDLRGDLDAQALKEVIGEIGSTFPQLKMRLKEVTERGRHRLVWDEETHSDLDFIAWDASASRATLAGLDSLLSCLAPTLNRERNLFDEPAGEIHLVKLDRGHHLLALVASHVAADALTFAEIAKDSMIRYHERVTGHKLEFHAVPHVASIGLKRTIPQTKTVWKDYWATCKQALLPYTTRCGLPRGNGSPDNSDECHAIRSLSPEDSELIVKASIRARAAFVDYVMASAMIAIDRWNGARGEETASLTAGLTVNMTGRFASADGPNADSALYFRCEPEERKDAVQLARRIHRVRIGQFRNQEDLKYAKAIGKLNKLLRVFPLGVRQRILSRILQRHQTSFALTFMGVVWPSAKGRKITGDSYLTSAGGLEIAEVFAVPYKLVSRTPLYLSAYFFRKRLNLILSAAGWHFTREETEAFLDLIVSMLKSSHALRQ